MPSTSPLRHAQTGELLTSPLIQGIVIVITLAFAIGGMVYGKTIGCFQTSHDWVKALENTFATLAGYLVLMFFAAQFIAWFSWSELGPIFAIQGAQWLSRAEISPIILLLGIILLTTTLNLFIGSASAKWGLLAPVLVPMMLLLGVEPDWVQMAYRIGDSSSNIITPLMPYFALVLAFAQQEDARIQLGGLLAIMLPYTLSFLLLWSGAFFLWWIMDLPLGV
jgi:aminobenzoyl-glutamate transport protein